MSVSERIPELSDKELENLHANAVRLSQAGSQSQQVQAETLLPLLSVEMEVRRERRTQTRKEQRAANSRRDAARSALLKEHFG